MPLRACMEAHTHREYLTWMAWLEEEWSNPSRTDMYLMQIAAETRRTIAKRPSSVKVSDFQLKFHDRDSKSKLKMTREQAAAFSKAKWLGIVGMKPDGR